MCIWCAWKARACATSGVSTVGSRLVVDKAIKPCAGHFLLAYLRLRFGKYVDVRLFGLLGDLVAPEGTLSGKGVAG